MIVANGALSPENARSIPLGAAFRITLNFIHKAHLRRRALATSVVTLEDEHKEAKAMAWQLSGRSMELCSCKLLCPCWLGPEGVPDQGWCGGALGFDIQRSNSDGVDLGGTKVAFAAEWPGNFFDGKGTARLYIGDTASAEQRRELEAIFSGKKGGLLEGLWGAVISNWLPTESTRVEIGWDDSPFLRVGSFGQATLTTLRDQSGKPTRMEGAAAQAAFQFASMDLASSKGSSWSDPNLRQWQGDSGTLHQFNWSA